MNQTPTGFSDIIADDRNLVTYRPKLNQITGSVTATILLQQIMYWWKISHKRAFYKFNAPCNHQDYREGDSWQEELGFSKSELLTARSRIAKKVTKGSKKSEIMKTALVIYWTDRERRTWYEVNEAALNKAIAGIYLCKSGNRIYIESQETGFTGKSGNPDLHSSETTSEITPETTNIPPTAEIFSPPISESEVKQDDARNSGSNNHGSPDDDSVMGSVNAAGTAGEEKVDIVIIQESPSETEGVVILDFPKGGDVDGHRESSLASANSKVGGRVGGKGKADPLLMTLERKTAANKEGNWAVPPEAGGDDPWADGPVDAFCTVLAEIPPLLLADDKRRDWARKLAQIGEEWNRPPEFIVTPALMAKAIKAVPQDAKIGWKTYTNPFMGSFAHDIGPLLLNGGRPTNRKEKTHETRKRVIAPNAAPRRVATKEEAAAILGSIAR